MGAALVAVLDDDADVGHSVISLLEGGGVSAMAFTDGAMLLRHEALLEFRCVLLDVEMAGLNGFDVLLLYRKLGGKAPVIILTGMLDQQTAIQALRSGATDFLTKPYDPDDLVRSVRKSVGLDVKAAEGPGRELERRFQTLTQREREVFKLISEGLQTKRIASRLGVSPRTVDIYRRNLMDKMQARHVAEVIHFGSQLRETLARIEIGPMAPAPPSTPPRGDRG